jgi:hypothetical protein
MFRKNINQAMSQYKGLINPVRRQFSSGMQKVNNTPAYLIGGLGVAGLVYAGLQAGMLRSN